MTNYLFNHLDSHALFSPSGTKNGKARYCSEHVGRKFGILGVTVLLASLVFAQASPRVTGVEPSASKVGDSVTVTGENLGKDSVSAVFLSDDKIDYKATLVEQSAGKIVMKVPQVKPGDYNVSIQVGNKILIEPVKFKVQE
jgi:hypothetical protein